MVWAFENYSDQDKGRQKVTITMRHIRAAKMCSSGARAWFNRHGFDWSDFLKHGIDSDKVLATGDAMAIRVVEVANGR